MTPNALLVVALVGLAADPPPPPSRPAQTLWLVQPLYPGQDLLAKRTEEAIHQLIPKEDRATEVIGRRELIVALKGKSVDLRCFFGEVACASPIDAMLEGLGFSRVVLLRAGQDETGYHFKIASFRPSSEGLLTAETSHRVLERALTGALVKVVPLASTVDVTTTPPGATVFVDGDKVGVTPLSTQILPGEHVIKLDLPGYKPIELTQDVAVKGKLEVSRELEKLPARIIINAQPPGTEIYVDGKLAGKDKVDQGIEPGPHTFRLVGSNYHPYQTTAQIKPDETYSLNKTLDPTGWQGVKMSMQAAQEEIYARKSSFVVAFEAGSVKSGDWDAKHRHSEARINRLASPSSPSFNTLSLEFGVTGRYFGLMIFGGAYSWANSKPWRFAHTTDPTQTPAQPTTDLNTNVDMLSIRGLQPQLRIALWRFTFGVQGGFELRGCRITEQTAQEAFNDGFYFIDAQVAAQGTVRLFVVEGLFLEGAFRRTWTLGGISGGSGPGVQGFRGGLGYAF